MTAIVIENISKTFYPPAKGLRGFFGQTDHHRGLQALQSIDLKIEHGEFFGLLGPNGAGKTTLISILAGMTYASTGRASVCGYDVVEQYWLYRRDIGVVTMGIDIGHFYPI